MTCTEYAMARWKVRRGSAFKRQYKNIGYVRQSKVDKVIVSLATSTNPASIGRYKKHAKVFTYNIDKGDRLIYTLDYFRNEIILIRVCDHKSAYGRD